MPNATPYLPPDPECKDDLIHLSSNGDYAKLSDLLRSLAPEVLSEVVNAKDSDGLNSILHASCWGYKDVVELLIVSGADVNSRDSKGWTPIVWAASNGHVQVVERLIENGADCGVTSDSGKSIWDVLRHSEHRDTIVPVLGNPPDEKDLASADWVVPDFDDMDSLTFDWTICRYDQMIVFDEASLDRILHTTIHELHTHSLDADTPAIVAANIIFLCARFAHYMNPPDVLERLFAKTFAAIEREVQSHPEDPITLVRWIANCHHLVYFLKRDEGLRSASYTYQAGFAEFVHELCEKLGFVLKKRMLPIMEAGIVEFRGGDASNVQMESILGVFTGTGKRNNSMMRKTGGLLSSIGGARVASVGGFLTRRKSELKLRMMTPQDLVQLFLAIKATMQQSCVHIAISNQVLLYLFRVLNVELFNRIIGSNDLVARSHASHIQMNLIDLVEGLENDDHDRLKDCLKPTLHLLHFTQVITSTPSLFDFLTLKTLDSSLTTAQVRRAMSVYRFEVGEQDFAKDVEEFLVREWEEVSLNTRVDIVRPELVEFLDVSANVHVKIPTFTAAGESVWIKSGMEKEPVVPTDVLRILDE